MKARNKFQEATIQFAFIIKKSDLIMKATRKKKICDFDNQSRDFHYKKLISLFCLFIYLPIKTNINVSGNGQLLIYFYLLSFPLQNK